jgi:Tol biopolymer transport system component
MSVSVSPDEKTLVFDHLDHIYSLPASGGEARVLTGDSGIALNFEPAISPDGKAIAFISDRGGQNNLWVMDIDGSHPRRRPRSRVA